MGIADTILKIVLTRLCSVAAVLDVLGLTGNALGLVLGPQTELSPLDGLHLRFTVSLVFSKASPSIGLYRGVATSAP